MVQDRTEYMVGGTKTVAIESDSMQSAGLGGFAKARRFFQLWVESQKEPAIRPNPIVDVGRPVSRVEMNAKNAPLTPASPHRRLSSHFLRPRAIKNALTTPTLSYTALPSGHSTIMRWRCQAVVPRLTPAPPAGSPGHTARTVPAARAICGASAGELRAHPLLRPCAVRLCAFLPACL